ncbi:MAG: response regulator [Candidatus Omnitrophota bacterium]
MNKKALIVDDALFMRNYIREILKKAGFDICAEASTALEAVNKYKQLRPDLITMDIIMPKIEELDGIGAIKEIVEFDPKAKVIVISAIGEEHLVTEANRYGVKAFIIKPFKPQHLLDKVNEIFLQI